MVDGRKQVTTYIYFNYRRLHTFLSLSQQTTCTRQPLQHRIKPVFFFFEKEKGIIVYECMIMNM